MAYLLFGGEEFYALSGCRDLMGIFDTIDEAKEHFAKNPRVWGEIALLTDGYYDLAGHLEVKLVIGERFGEFEPYPEWAPPPPRRINPWLSESIEP